MRKQAITYSPNDSYDWICCCGNTWESLGFHECDSEGNALDDETLHGPQDLFFCYACERIIDADTLQVYGKRSKTATDLVSVIKSAWLGKRKTLTLIKSRNKHKSTEYECYQLTKKEIKEIASFRELRREWGKTKAEMIVLLDTNPSAKFTINDGRVKEVITLLPDVLDPYAPPYKIARGHDGKLFNLN